MTKEGDRLVSDFVKACAAEGIPELGAHAVIRQLRKIAFDTRVGRLSDSKAVLRILQTLDAARRRVATIQRREVKALAKAFKAGEVTLADVRGRLRGAA